MARARNIKPAFFKNEELADSSFETRLLFIGLWTLADREGRLEDRPRRIRAEIFPFDGIDVEPMLAELERLGFLVRYEVDSERFIHITNFVKHQDPHYREKASDIPPMPGTENQILATGVTRTQRARILKRDDAKCQHCGSTDHPCIDHVIPVSRGGDSSDENLQVLCLPCNTKKGNKLDSTSNQHQVELDSTKEVLVPLIPDSLIPDSLSSDSLIPDSPIPEEKPLQLAAAPAPQSNVRTLEPKARTAKPKTEQQQANAATWQAYADAYFARYHVEPVRNAKVNAQIAQLVARLGADEAPHVAAYFVTINDQFYLRSLHDFGLLVSKAEAIRTQWATGRQMNGTTAQQIERKQANLQAGQEAAQRIMSREGRKENEFL